MENECRSPGSNGLWKDTMTFFLFTPTEKEFKSYHVANHIKGLLLRFP